MNKEIITIQLSEEVHTPTSFAMLVAKKGINNLVNVPFWVTYGSRDAIKCIIISHNKKCEYRRVSIECKYQEFIIK